MHVGCSIAFQNPFDALDDAEVYEREIGLALRAESLGFDSIWTVEHHFTDYTMCPDPLQLLGWLAPQTRLQLGTGVLVLPWHDPVRLAERIALADNLCGGRLLLGVGRGIARVEYEGFGVSMDTSRQRFVETAEAVLGGLETGVLDYEGTLVSVPRRDIRPRPQRSFAGRTFAAAVSPESMPMMARLGIGLLVIPQKPWDVVAADFATYRSVWTDVHGDAPMPPALCGGFVFVDRDRGRAEAMAHRYIGDYYRTVLRHYEFASQPHEGVAGYEFYTHISRYIGRHGEEGAVSDFVSLMPWGTPDEVIEKVAHIREQIGIAAFMPNFAYAGMPWDEATRNVELFVSDVMPALKQWDAPALDCGVSLPI
jgi:alkanesulfonate monooxygenase SsuD/methylene tetrahydromethanopterin reductase-like flavin-dependent oxidoreductase (luciferase family)